MKGWSFFFDDANQISAEGSEVFHEDLRNLRVASPRHKTVYKSIESAALAAGMSKEEVIEIAEAFYEKTFGIAYRKEEPNILAGQTIYNQWIDMDGVQRVCIGTVTKCFKSLDSFDPRMTFIVRVSVLSK
jgi:hypothetical protein